MKKNTRRIARSIAGLAAAIGLAIGASIPAQANDWEITTSGNASVTSSCPGRQIDGGTIPGSDGKFVWKLYYSTANSGTNCFIVYNHSGRPTWMTGHLATSDNKNAAFDTGTYSQFLGAMVVRGTAGRCISFSAGVTAIWFERNKVHCG